MRIVLDENLPRPMKGFFGALDTVVTVQELGMSGTSNGELLSQLEGQFDVFVTADQNLRYQQNLTERRIAIVELPTNRLPALRTMSVQIVEAVTTAEAGTYIQLSTVIEE